jgi:hypothetical protein
MRSLTLADFKPFLRKPMKVKAAAGVFELLLSDAQAIPGSMRDGGGFRLVFLGPLQPMLGQGNFRFLVGAEPHEIFIVPLGPVADKMRYEAIFF